LKHPHRQQDAQRIHVAPPAGAWIETEILRVVWGYAQLVAPPAGAWIETGVADQESNTLLSRPLRARGLKLLIGQGIIFRPPSRPLRARGLKPLSTTHFLLSMSRPLRARGLKLPGGGRMNESQVAPPAGAWIETNPLLMQH